MAAAKASSHGSNELTGKFGYTGAPKYQYKKYVDRKPFGINRLGFVFGSLP